MADAQLPTELTDCPTMRSANRGSRSEGRTRRAGTRRTPEKTGMTRPPREAATVNAAAAVLRARRLNDGLGPGFRTGPVEEGPDQADCAGDTAAWTAMVIVIIFSPPATDATPLS